MVHGYMADFLLLTQRARSWCAALCAAHDGMLSLGGVGPICIRTATAVWNAVHCVTCRLSDGEKMDSMSLLLYMAPVASLALVPAAVMLEPQSIQAARDLSVEHPCAVFFQPRRRSPQF